MEGRKVGSEPRKEGSKGGWDVRDGCRRLAVG